MDEPHLGDRNDFGKEVLLKLGELSANVQNLIRDFSDEKVASRDNRAAMHRRLDEQAKGLADVKTQLSLSRQSVDDLIKTQADIVMPAVSDWRDMKATGLKIVSLLALGGVSVGAALTWFSDQAAAGIRHWLSID